MKSLPTLVLHIRDTDNVGDYWSSPAHYFDFPGPLVVRDVRAFLASPERGPWGLIVCGGGAWRKDLERVRRLFPVTRKVAWGVGITHPSRQGPNKKGEHIAQAKGWDLYCHRDTGMEGWWVPCASCMHPAFEAPGYVQHEMVYYGHGSKAPLRWAKSLGLGPHMTNLGAGLEETLAFLASGRVIVTSSYHGAYWGRLLGRTVIPLPRGSKFWHLPKAPLSLEDHRDRNRAFYHAVRGLLEVAA